MRSAVGGTGTEWKSLLEPQPLSLLGRRGWKGALGRLNPLEGTLLPAGSILLSRRARAQPPGARKGHRGQALQSTPDDSPGSPSPSFPHHSSPDPRCPAVATVRVLSSQLQKEPSSMCGSPWLYPPCWHCLLWGLCAGNEVGWL